MTGIDWLVLASTLAFIVVYGVVKTAGVTDADTYLRGGSQDRWHTIGLSVMATQASAITFLSTPGQAYQDGMGFVQLYFGLPIAMIVLSAVVVPRYYKARVFTAYEFLERRFDLKTRQLTALLFLIQRGLAAGITIYAPSILLSHVLGWSLNLTSLAVGGLVIVYTVLGGTAAVSRTQKHQMVIMMAGMLATFVWVLSRLPPSVTFRDALVIAGAMGKMNIIDSSFDASSRYNVWSGVFGGFFLALAYFGTDQSQVQRYLSGRSIREIRLGLLFNGLLKIPMQFLILLTGLMVLVFHQFEEPPIFFNKAEWKRAATTDRAPEAQMLEQAHRDAFVRRRQAAMAVDAALDTGNGLQRAVATSALRLEADAATAIHRRAQAFVSRALPGAEAQDGDYIFLGFILDWLPQGIVGLLMAVIFCAAMSSTAGELTALGTTTVVDFYRRSLRTGCSDRHYLRAAQVFTAFWGVVAVAFASFASLVDNLVEAVNIVGSVFYGTILGVFLTAFFAKRLRGTAVFVGALLAESAVIACSLLTDLGFLWWNVLGCGLVWLFATLVQSFSPQPKAT